MKNTITLFIFALLLSSWYNWNADAKSSGEVLKVKGYGWFKWENGKAVEAYNAFDPTAYNAVMAVE